MRLRQGLAVLLWVICAGLRADGFFQIRVVDEATGRGVPLVELGTVNSIRVWTDSNGIAAFAEPGLMGQSVFFHVRSHGYEFAKDGFGYRGRALNVSEGGRAELKLRRLNVAERLYRVTGAGIYRDSLLLGLPVPLRQPLLNALVFGSDSVVNSVYRGRIYWFWGDTNRPGYPLGNFNVPGATSRLSADGGLDPAVGVDLDYFVDGKGFAKAMAPMPGDGPTWIGGLVTVPDRDGTERLFASYVKVRNLLDVYQRGLARYSDDRQQFEKVAEFGLGAPAHPGGHPFRRTVGGVEYVYFANPYPLLRVRAAAAALAEPAEYEAFSCLKPGTTVDAGEVERDTDGLARYAWRRQTPVVSPSEQAKLVKAGQLQPSECLLQLRDTETGKSVTAHSGSVYWNAYRGRWVLITVECYGSSSLLGEVWYAEGDTPVGPWVYARKVVTHEKYSFYNPKQHPMFDQDGGRVLYFEGTYTHTFSGNPEQTPRYDYNQIMYRLDLADARLILPVPVYAVADGTGLAAPSPRESAPAQTPQGPRAIAFFAPDRPFPGSIALCWQNGAAGRELVTDGSGAAAFHALPADAKTPPPGTVPLFAFAAAAGNQRSYAVGQEVAPAGSRRLDPPLCLVWRSPVPAAIPWD